MPLCNAMQYCSLRQPDIDATPLALCSRFHASLSCLDFMYCSDRLAVLSDLKDDCLPCLSSFKSFMRVISSVPVSCRRRMRAYVCVSTSLLASLTLLQPMRKLITDVSCCKKTDSEKPKNCRSSLAIIMCPISRRVKRRSNSRTIALLADSPI